ncbi:hypothetical protein BDV93DRAFT_512356 [Ceratobasidium sp. AG-I]|nr:hypothetical protein BDV93DRAFT_512356 [Ceratobasidium sp. AG-I]
MKAFRREMHRAWNGQPKPEGLKPTKTIKDSIPTIIAGFGLRCSLVIRSVEQYGYGLEPTARFGQSPKQFNPDSLDGLIYDRFVRFCYSLLLRHQLLDGVAGVYADGTSCATRDDAKNWTEFKEQPNRRGKEGPETINRFILATHDGFSSIRMRFSEFLFLWHQGLQRRNQN